MNSSSFWKTTLSPSDTPCLIEAGEVRILLKVEEGDWFAGTLREDDVPPSIQKNLESFSNEPEWQRIGSVQDVPQLQLTPAYPDRALVVRPKVSYSVLPRERVQFYVSVSVWIRLTAKEDLTLLNVPAYTLSNTWFGLPTDGELAYAMRTLARREGDHLDLHPLRVVCPVRIKNQSKEILKFERICIRPKFLSLYQDEHLGLWANESSMIVRTAQEASRVAYARKAPTNLKNPHRWQKGEEDPTGTQLLRALSVGKGFFNE